ncbi:MAG: CPBP family intramembrane glutamic endopeptidase [Bacillota bacterium]|jgi:membrane protease YdiL (CAAX protease family)
MTRRKTRDLIFAVLLAYLIPLLSSRFADVAINSFAGLDPDGVFAWRFLHHIAQTVLSLAAIVVLGAQWKLGIAEWGLNLNKSDWSMRVFWRFCLGCAVYGVVFNVLMASAAMQSAVSHPMTARNVTGSLLFMFTMPGIAEELLFRSLIVTILARSWKSEVRFPGFTVPTAGVISAVLFSMAHIGFTISPFKVTYLDPVQLVIAFGFGIFYAFMYRNTGSLLGPVLIHNVSDGMLAAISYAAKLVR